MSTIVSRHARPPVSEHGVHRPDRRLARVVVASLAAGAVVAVLLTMGVVPGASEGVTTGAALLAFGLGWAMIRVLSVRTAQPQRWATVPAIAMTATGAVLMVVAPADHTLTALTWVWPPFMLVLAGWTLLRMRRTLAGSARWVVTIVLALLAAASSGAVVGGVSASSFEDTYLAPGSTLDVGDHSLHLDCRGHGQPTVVLVSGLGEFSASWARVMDGVASTTRVCAYDRVGQGWSDDGDDLQDGLAAARDLQALLAAAGERGPFVLAGHSIGGPYALTYADQYTDEVAGMVLLDGTSPRNFEAIPSYPLQYAFMRRAYGILPSLARLGLGPLLAGSHLPDADAAPVEAMTASPRAARNARNELLMLPKTLRQAQALTTFGDRPLIVLTSDETALDTEGWTEEQQRMAALSTVGIQQEVTASHAGLVEDPNGAALSVHAIASVVQAVRAGASIPTR
jgi:pimeloyl-ACP methyl ester carboxylesterase